MLRLSEAMRSAETAFAEKQERLHDEMDEQKEAAENHLREVTQKANQEVQDLEKELVSMKEEYRMVQEERDDFEKQVRITKEENDSLAK